MNLPRPKVGLTFMHATRGYGCRITQVTRLTVRYVAINVASAGGSFSRSQWDKKYGGPS